MNKRKKEPANKVKVIFLVACVFTLATAVGASINLYKRSHAPDPAKMTKNDAVKYMATKEFSVLPSSEKEKYLKAVGGDDPRKIMTGADLTKDERDAIRRNTGKLRNKEMRERMKKFFAMSKEEQNQFLDNMIQEMKSRQQSGGGPPGGGTPPGGSGGSGGPPRGSPAAMFENTDSTTRAQMHEFHELLHARMQQGK